MEPLGCFVFATKVSNNAIASTGSYRKHHGRSGKFALAPEAATAFARLVRQGTFLQTRNFLWLDPVPNTWPPFIHTVRHIWQSRRQTAIVPYRSFSSRTTSAARTTFSFSGIFVLQRPSSTLAAISFLCLYLVNHFPQPEVLFPALPCSATVGEGAAPMLTECTKGGDTTQPSAQLEEVHGHLPTSCNVPLTAKTIHNPMHC